MFWKSEHLLFHMKTTVLHNFYLLVEQNIILYKNVETIWEFSSLKIWDLVESRQKTLKYQEFGAARTIKVDFRVVLLTNSVCAKFGWK